MPVTRLLKKSPAYPGQLSLFDALLLPVLPARNPADPAHPAPLYRFVPTAYTSPGSEVERVNRNVAAIHLLKRVQADGRAATEEEYRQLSHFSGWGACASVWDDASLTALTEARQTGKPIDGSLLRWANQFAPLRHQLDTLLTRDEQQTAKASVLSAYYTPDTVVSAIWQAVERLGFRGGHVLEPGAGIGAFIGHMPTELRQVSTVMAIEKDSLSAQLLSVCYPEVTVQATGFEDADLPQPFDLVVGNVPFGDFSVFDPAYRALSREKIHNFFIGKSASLLRPGGLLALITTAGTLDSERRAFRQWLTDAHLDLVGAIRLPGNVFAGTQVTTDVLFMRKGDGVARSAAAVVFDRLVTIRQQRDPNQPQDTPQEEAVTRLLRINEYFDAHPSQVVGEMYFADEVGQGGLYRAGRATCFLGETAEFADRLSAAVQALPVDVYDPLPTTQIAPLPVTQPLLSGLVRVQGKEVPKTRLYADYSTLKDAFRQLWRAERDDQQAEDRVSWLRQQLHTAYLHFVSRYGRLTRNRAISWLETVDAQLATVQALETIARQPVPGNRTRVVIGEATILRHRVYPRYSPPTQADTLPDAVALCRARYGQVSPRRVANLLSNATEQTVLADLLREQFVFIDPQTDQPIEAQFYLSGQVRAKLAEAEEKAQHNPLFRANVAALQAIVPDRIPAHLIDFGLASNWLPAYLIGDWMQQQFGLAAVDLAYNTTAHLYVCRRNSFEEPTPRNRAEGTAHRLGTQLVEAALNHKTIVITKTVYDPAGNERSVRDMEAISAAVQAQERLQELFVDYARAQYAAEVEAQFNERFCSHVPRRYEVPTFAQYPGATTNLSLRQHQRRGVSRILDQDCTLAHSVGTGKTLIMQTAGMELVRLGICRKALFSVQNSTVADFTAKFQQQYPAALLCVPTTADMDAKNRAAFLRRIATNAYDAVIIPQSFLKQIPDDAATVEAFIREEIDRLTAVLSLQVAGGKSGKKTAKAIEQLKARILSRRFRQADRSVDPVPTFGELGIDALFLDEAHRYKRLGFFTNRRNVKGIDTAGSEEALSALMKCRSVQARRGRVVLATGTPISNTMAEAWTMLRFVGPERLRKTGLTTFDEFAGAFGQVIPSFELSASGSFKVIDRFAKFVNVRVLSELYRSHVDVILTDEVNEFKHDKSLPQLKNGEFTRIILPQTPGIADQMLRIRQDLFAYEQLMGQEKRDQSHVPLVLFGVARKATLDLRLIDPNAADEPGSKTNRAVTELLSRYQLTQAYNGLQLVFADLFQSPAYADVWGTDEDQPAWQRQKVANRFNLFTDLTRKLIAAGVPADQIATVPDDMNKREAVFDKARSGAIRILMGSSERMGVGVNVQDRLYALHHLDAPLRPTDHEQRNGRGLRHGNLHAIWGIPVEVLTYGVDKTMDATAYGRMAVKQRFIHQMLKGDVADGSIPDISADDDFAALSFEQMMATLSGSSLAVLLSTKQLDADRLHRQQKTFNEGVIRAVQIVARSRAAWQQQQTQLPTYRTDIDQLKSGLLGPEGTLVIHTVRVNEETHTVDTGKALAGFLHRLATQSRHHWTKQQQATVVINMIPIRVTAMVFVGGEVEFRYQYGMALQGEFYKPSGFLHSLRARLDNLEQGLTEAEASICRYQQEEAAFTEKAGQVFTRTDELARLDKEVNELKRQLEAEAEPTVTDQSATS